ncbi:MAG: HpsJ family protein [Cyanobacteriota bacterium]|jgi:hypothetical protein
MNRLKYAIQDFFQYTDFLAPFRRHEIELAITDRSPSRLIAILGFFGYLITLMSIIDFIYAVIPPQVQNPVWELATMNLLLAQVWFFFVGFGLILASYILRYHFYPQSGLRGWELALFKGFRWLVLFLAVVCLLMTPLIFVDTLRVHRINTLQVKDASQSQLAQLTEAERRLETVTDLSQLQALLGPNASALQGRSLGEVKAQLQANIKTQKTQIAERAQAAHREKRTNLLKSSSRNVIAALIASLGFLFMFWKTAGMFP